MKTKLISFSLILVLVGLLFGCVTAMYTGSEFSPNPVAPFAVRLSQTNEKQTQDYHRSKRVGFTATDELRNLGNLFPLVDLSADQKEIVRLLGIPEYYCSFPALNGKRIEEWVYLVQDYLVQFSYGNLVYLGSVDDKEKTLIELGPPTDIVLLEFAGMRKEFFKYKTRFEIRVFHNDKLVVAQ